MIYWRAYDENLIVHLVRVRGETVAACSADDQWTHVSPMALSPDTPVSCTRCLVWEAAQPCAT